jgi:hypothetical protein
MAVTVLRAYCVNGDFEHGVSGPTVPRGGTYARTAPCSLDNLAVSLYLLD